MRIAITFENRHVRARHRWPVAVTAMFALVATAASPVSAQTTPVTAASAVGTVSVQAPQTKSIAISTAAFSFSSCSGGSSTETVLGFPNGVCVAPAISVTNNGDLDGLISVQAGDLSDTGGHSWTNACSSSACTLVPGDHQFRLDLDEVRCTSGPLCVSGETPSVAIGPAALSMVDLPHDAAIFQVLRLTGPPSNDGTASSYSQTVTWTIS